MKPLFYHLLFVLLLLPFWSEAQCLEYAKREGVKVLEAYQHNGNFNTTPLKKGENVELMEHFSANCQNRIAVVSPQGNQNFVFEVLDFERNTLFSNKNSHKAYYDFSLNKSQMLIIRISVPSNAAVSGTVCVAVLIGKK